MDLDVPERELLDRIFETSPTGIVVLTPAGQNTGCNHRAEQLLELDVDTIAGRTHMEPEWTFVDEAGEPIPESEHPFVLVEESGGPIFSRKDRIKRPPRGRSTSPSPAPRSPRPTARPNSWSSPSRTSPNAGPESGN